MNCAISRGMQPVASCPWPWPGSDQVLAVAQTLHDLVRVALRRHRIVAAGQHQRRHVAVERLAEVRVHRTARPLLADRSHAGHERRAHVGPRELLRPSRSAASQRGASSLQTTAKCMPSAICSSISLPTRKYCAASACGSCKRLRFVNEQRQRRYRLIGVAQQPNRGAEARNVELRARDRAGDADPESRPSPAACASAPAALRTARGSAEIAARIRVSRAQRCNALSIARCASIATSGPSATSAGTTPSRIAARTALRITAHVVLRDARAIGDAVEIHLADSRARRARRRGRVRRCWSCSSADRRAARRGTPAPAPAASADRAPRTRNRPAACSPAGWSGRCRADRPAPGRGRAGCARRPAPRSGRNRWRPARDRRSG